MPETNWGRKETIIWPPHKPIYTFGAVFFAVVLTGLFVYLHFAFVLTPLQQFDLPIYIKTTIVASIRQSSKYQLLLMADKKGHTLYASDVDVAAGSTPQANAHPIPLVLSDFARQRGMVYLYRSAPTGHVSCLTKERFLRSAPSCLRFSANDAGGQGTRQGFPSARFARP
jgi:hypothetical protein